MMGAEGLVLALGAVLLGGLLGQLTRRRRVLDAPAPAQSGFADRASAPLPVVFDQMDFEQSASFLELESAMDLFLDDAHPPASETATAASQLQAEVDARPPVEVNGFDHEAAANEVARVRKSLAQKRAARAHQRAHDVSVHSSVPLMDRSLSAPRDAVTDQMAHAVMHGDERDEPSGGVDLPLDLPEELTLELHSAESEMPVAEAQLMAQDSQLARVPFDTPVEPEAQSDAAVQLALALELETVGLLHGAREIAREVFESSDDALRLKAEALMARLDVLETA
jgi:hypothetical protein